MEGNDLKILRQKLGLTQEEFAKKIGTYKSTISEWENGSRKISRLYANLIKTTFKV